MVNSQDFFAVLTEKAGHFSQDITKQITEAFSYRGYTVQFCLYTDNQQLTKDLTEALNQGYQSFLAVGGDGTVNLVASMLWGKPHRLGIIPAGTTNTVARVLGIPLNIKESIELAASSEKIQSLDGLEVNGRVFLLNVSVGLSSIAISSVDSQKKTRFGILAYAIGGFSNIRRIRPRRFQVQVDGRTFNTRAVELHVTNTGIVGTPRFQMYPDSKTDDGRAEILTLRRWSIGELFNAALDVLTRRKRQAICLVTQGKDILIQSALPIEVQADGDILQQTPVRIRVLPQAIHFIVP